MSASKVMCNSDLFPSIDTSILNVNAVQSRLKDKSVEVIKEIATDNTNRKGYIENVQLLTKGIFYPNEYFNSLKETKSSARLNALKNKDSFFHGYASPKHFDMRKSTTSPSGKEVTNFVIKKGILPGEALKAMKEGLSLLGCGEVCQIAQYAAIEDILGTIKFNNLFTSDSLTPLMIGRMNDNPIGRLRNYLMQVNPSDSELKKGDVVYIENANTYFLKHFIGHARGYNTLCVDDTIGSQKFTTLGLPADGVTHDEIQDVLISDWNCPFTSLESFTEKVKRLLSSAIGNEKLAKSEELKTARISSQEFKEQGGGRVTIVCELDAEKITALANSSLEDARNLLDGYRARQGSRLSIN